jgi:diadenosine tetraphosphate (Ap4A) HIT family hydrolase
MDIAPLRPGHVLVLPRMHCQHLDELPVELRAHVLEVGNRIGLALRRAPALRCDGVHFVINDGRAAHQTVPHLHLHVLPRRQGDIAGLLGSLLRRPVQSLLGGADKNELDRQAQIIAAQISNLGPA